MVRDKANEKPVGERIALYASISSVDRKKDDVERQMQRLKDYVTAEGDQVSGVVTELASEFNE